MATLKKQEAGRATGLLEISKNRGSSSQREARTQRESRPATASKVLWRLPQQVKPTPRQPIVQTRETFSNRNFFAKHPIVRNGPVAGVVTIARDGKWNEREWKSDERWDETEAEAAGLRLYG